MQDEHHRRISGGAVAPQLQPNPVVEGFERLLADEARDGAQVSRMALLEDCEISTLQFSPLVAERRLALVVDEHVVGETDLPARLLRQLAELVLFS